MQGGRELDVVDVPTERTRGQKGERFEGTKNREYRVVLIRARCYLESDRLLL